MSESGAFWCLLVALTAVVVGLVGAWVRPTPHPARPAPPRVGRSAEDVAAGPEDRFRRIRRHTADELAAEARDAADRTLEAALGGPPPEFVKSIVVYGLPGDLPETTLEEGTPWHVVIDRDGKIGSTPRYRRRRPGTPPGVPAITARDALHVAVLRARDLSPERSRRLAELCGYLSRTLSLGPDRVISAHRIPGADPSPVPGFPDLIPRDGEGR